MWEKTCTHRKERKRPRRIEKTRHKSPPHLSLSAFLTRPLLSLLSPLTTGGCTTAGKSKTTTTATEEQEIEAFNDIDPNTYFPGFKLLGKDNNGCRARIQGHRLQCA
jgi:hypothetical protein